MSGSCEVVVIVIRAGVDLTGGVVVDTGDVVNIDVVVDGVLIDFGGG